jgi:hypothetical protein
LLGIVSGHWSSPQALRVTALVTLPAGPLAGVAYGVWSRAPFVLGIVLQCVALVLTLGLASRAEVAE